MDKPCTQVVSSADLSKARKVTRPCLQDLQSHNKKNKGPPFCLRQIARAALRRPSAMINCLTRRHAVARTFLSLYKSAKAQKGLMRTNTDNNYAPLALVQSLFLFSHKCIANIQGRCPERIKTTADAPYCPWGTRFLSSHAEAAPTWTMRLATQLVRPPSP